MTRALFLEHLARGRSGRDGAVTAHLLVDEPDRMARTSPAILGSETKISYGADWSEYNNHQTGDTTGELFFHLDPLWADSNIDFVGIDNYLPLADWRDGAGHADYNAASGPISDHDADYLTANIRGGEDYDWYYANAAARTAQSRTPISDGAYGKPWVYRAKDFRNWWANHHYDRPGGVENDDATAWVPGSKPIWFTELGCPAVDKGANQPNVFYDPKSVESALPYFSNGERDDLIQRRFLEAHFGFWNVEANNPAADAYVGRMVDAQNIYVWTWDARPYPFFPAREDIWGDAPNYQRGHWLNGRLGAVFLPDLVDELCIYSSFADADTTNLSGLVTGFAVTSTMATRDALTPLGLAYHFDAVESEGQIKFVARGRPAALMLDEDDLALGDHENGFGYSVHRAQETDLPAVSRISYVDGENDYRDAASEARRLVGHSQRVAQSQLPLVLDQGQAIGIGERLLLDAWVMRETMDFALPPARLSLEPTDEIVLQTNGRPRRLRLTQIDDGPSRQMQAVATDPSVYERLVGPARIGTNGSGTNVVQAGRASVTFLDLPLLSGGENPYAPHVAAYAQPWPGEVAIYKSATDANYTRDTALTAPAILGVTTQGFAAGPLWRWDNVNVLHVRLFGGTLGAQDDLAVLGGANALALENADGEWEVLQFQAAALSDANTWSLSRLLRGQVGTESAMRDVVSAGARIVVLNRGVKQLALTADNYALPFRYLYGPAGRPLSDPAYQRLAKQFSGIGLRPFAPVHMRAALQGNDDVKLSWTRRNRVNADSWAQTEIPLSEESESYAIDILNGDAVVRTLSATSPIATYTAADQVADFGSLPASISFTVCQISAAFGRGVSTRKTCHVR